MTREPASDLVGGGPELRCPRCRRALAAAPGIAGLCELCEPLYFELREKLPLSWWFALGASVPCGLTYLLMRLAQGARGTGSHGIGVLAPVAFAMAVVACGKAAIYLRCRALQRSVARGDLL